MAAYEISRERWDDALALAREAARCAEEADIEWQFAFALQHLATITLLRQENAPCRERREDAIRFLGLPRLPPRGWAPNATIRKPANAKQCEPQRGWSWAPSAWRTCWRRGAKRRWIVSA